MPKCPSCGVETPVAGALCLTCASATRTQASAPPPSPTGPLSRPASAAPDGSRFPPGTLLAGRYRIVALLGRGGMGEVYRADDLALGQPVALKFLPAAFAQHPEALERFRNEVRIARRVSHPNVCRVYDLGELDGQLFLTMEYVDGEDLGSLLRRIGRLPTDKALEIARKLCAGLAAAHEQGVLHRDLKPSNVMLDGRGQVRLTDFGVAGLAGQIEGAEIRSGTPAYMAPEQLSGLEVTARSDIYSLGLVLYEIFAGRQPFHSDTVPGLLQERQKSAPASLTTLVHELDPAVERAIHRCLEPDPARRPASALAVAAALPGGDPLAAALAAGETPSPEMVAAAGEGAGLAPRVALALLLATLALIVVQAVLAYRTSALEKLRPPYSGEVLSLKARELIARFGYTAPPADTAWHFYWERVFLDHLRKTVKPAPRWSDIFAQRPTLLCFSYRQSQSPLTGEGVHSDLLTPGIVTTSDPPPIESGMVDISLDTQGRLFGFEAVPLQKLDPAPPAAEVDWNPLFAAAGLDPARFQPAEPLWTFLAASDTRHAWTGLWPGTQLPLRVEAASLRGRPVAFSLYSPWTKPWRAATPDPPAIQAFIVLLAALALLTCGGTALLARRNLARGRGDRRGAFRLATFIFAVLMVLWVCEVHLILSLGLLGMFFLAVCNSLFLALIVWTAYLGLEPYIRRRWPQIIISWTSLLGGGLRDPVVGRDVLIGAALGAFWALIGRLANLWPDSVTPQLDPLETLAGSRAAFGQVLQAVPYAVRNGLLFLFLLFLLRLLLRNQWLAGAAWALLFTGLNALAATEHPLFSAAVSFLIFGAMAVVTLRWGLLAVVVGYFLGTLLMNLRVTPDWSAWYSSGTLYIPLAIAAILAWAFRISLGGRRLWRKDWLE